MTTFLDIDFHASYTKHYLRINKALQKYYADNFCVLDHLFLDFVIDEELDRCNPKWAFDDVIFTEFDPNFPVPSHIISDSQRQQYILQILQNCYKNNTPTLTDGQPECYNIESTDVSDESKLINENVNVSSYCVNKERLIDNCLVIFIGISKYKDGISNINNMSNDYNYYKNIFQQLYNYNFISNDYDHQWNRNDIQNYIYKQRKTLFTSNGDGIKYNGLIVCISGHGTDDHLICSNGDKLSLKYIRSLFCDNSLHTHLINLPKIFIVDACRDGNVNNKNNLSNNLKSPSSISIMTRAKHYSSTILGTTEGHSVYGSLLAKYIAYAFKSHRNQNVSFADVYRTAGNKLFKDTQGCQQLILNEHDYDIDCIRFIPNKSHHPGTQTICITNTNNTDDDGIYQVDDDLSDMDLDIEEPPIHHQLERIIKTQREQIKYLKYKLTNNLQLNEINIYNDDDHDEIYNLKKTVQSLTKQLYQKEMQILLNNMMLENNNGQQLQIDYMELRIQQLEFQNQVLRNINIK